MKSPPPRLLLAALLVLVAGVYAQAVAAYFFWDDRYLILQNPVVYTGDVAKAWTEDLWNADTPYYRPLVMLGFIADYALFRYDATGYHLHSLLWHLAATGAMFALANGRLGPWKALACAVAFALHPIQSETVLWIAARNDLMCAAGVLGTLALLDRPSRAATAGAFALALVAMLSKEVALLLPILAVLWRLAWGERPRPRDVLVPGVAAAIVLAARIAAGVPFSFDREPVGPLDHVLPYLVYPVAWVTVPWPLTSNVCTDTPIEPVVWGGAALTLAVVAALTWAAPRRTLALVAMAGLVFAPSVSALVATGLVGERYLYLPLAFVSVAAIAALPLARPAVAGGLGALGVLALLVLGVRIAEFDSEYTLLQAAVRRQPQNPYPWMRLGIHATRIGRAEEGRAAFVRALHTPTPLMQACLQGVTSTWDVQGAQAARDIAEELDEACAANPEFISIQLRAILTAGTAEETEAYIQRLRSERRPMPPRDVPVRAALCEMQGDYACVGEMLARWEGEPATMREEMAILEEAQWAPGALAPQPALRRKAGDGTDAASG